MPFLTTAQVAFTLVLFAVVYSIIFLFGSIYIYVLLGKRAGVVPEVERAGGQSQTALFRVAGKRRSMS